MDFTWIILAVIVVIVALKAKGLYRSPAALAEIARALDGGARLVDVRSPAEFASGHLDGAVNVPLGTSPDKVGPPERPVVLYCASGSRSAAFARQLRGMGYKQVHDLGPMGNGRRLPRTAGRS